MAAHQARLFPAGWYLHSRVLDLACEIRSEGVPSGRSHVALVALRNDATGKTEQVIKQLRRRFPALSVYVCTFPEQQQQLSLTRLARAGAGEVFVLSCPSDFRTLSRRIDDRLAAAPPIDLIRQVAEGVRDAMPRAVAVHCLLEGFRRQRVVDVEDMFGHDHKRMNARLRRCGLITVGKLLRVGRLAHVQALLDSRGHSLAELARLFDFGESKALRAALDRALDSGLIRGGSWAIWRQ